jgi:hypothetical protein
MKNKKVKLSLQERSCLWRSIIGNSTPNNVLRKESDPLSKIGGMFSTTLPPIFLVEAVEDALLYNLKEYGYVQRKILVN